MVRIILNDGTVIDNLELNGNNFIAETEIPDSVFRNNLDSVSISIDGAEKGYRNLVLLSNTVRQGRSWIVLGEKSEAQLEKERLAAISEVLDTLLGVTE